MRLSEIAAKRIINIYDGAIIGSAGEADLVIDPLSGEVTELVMPPGGFPFYGNNKRSFTIPWQAIKKIGAEVIVVDIDENGRYQ
ncbi:MAG: YlmC/YmxH family sporulation protein [Bacillota bacterium]|jgi:YlmC/YmxH family sporulation protein